MVSNRWYLFKCFYLINGALAIFLCYWFWSRWRFFTDLSYYFSTNILFIINVLCIILLKTFIHINTQGLLFWMVNVLVISTIKAALAMYCTYLYSKFISRNTWISIIMAFLFVMSPLYYRFTVYWPFFSDVLFGCHCYYFL